MSATLATPLPADRDLTRGLTVLFLVLGVLWLWLALCRFTGSAWNDIRLVPAFMFAHGEPIYPAPGTGVISTWMYGPVPLALLWPATLMPSISGALLAAGGLNIALAVGTLIVGCATWPAPAARTGERLAAFSAALLLWPESSYRYLQADNAAVFFGLVSLGLLARFPAGTAPGWAAWGSAAAAVTALACKQVAVGPIFATVIWLGLARAWRTAGLQVVRLATVGAAVGVTALVIADPAGLWLLLVKVPRGLPWVADAGARLRELAPGIAVAAGLPLLWLVVRRPGWTSRGTPGQLAAIAWLACLPLGILAAFKTGGSINSFHGYQLILPALLLDLATHRMRRTAMFLVTAGLFAFSAWPTRLGPWRPALGLAEQAVELARTEPARLWFPWHPLASWYAEREFHHAEDGMYARFMAGQPLGFPHVRSRLPKDFRGVALPVGFSDWGIASSLIPPDTVATEEGAWQVWRWEPAAARKTP